MRCVLCLLLLMVPTIVYAMGPEYTSSVAYVKEHANAKEPIPKDALYVASGPGDPPVYAAVLAYSSDMSLRAVIDQSRYKDSDVSVVILRAKKPVVPVFDAGVKPGEKPEFKLLPGDMIWLCKPGIRVW